MKKVLALFLSVLLIWAVAAPAFAAPAPSLVTTASATQVKRGESFVITVSLSDKLLAKAFVIDFAGAFDTTVFQQDNSVRGMGWDSLYKEDVWDEEIQDWFSPITVNAKASDPVAAVVFGSTAQEMDGNLYKMAIKVVADAPFGTYEIKAKTGSYTSANGDVPFEGEIVAATVTVTHDCVISENYSKDDDGHWYGCTVAGCDKPVSKLPHDFANACDQLCDTCGHTRTTSHVTGNDWSTNQTHHWKECSVSGCGEILDKAAHTGGEATCTAKAVCSVCNASYGTLDATNHKNTEVRGAVTESCNAPGYTGDTYCKDCEKVVVPGTDIDPTGAHVDADGDWEANETHHFRTCGCTTEFDRALHTGGTATCKEKAVCTVCGTAYGSLNPANHVGDTYLVGQKEASCYEEGYTGDTYCSDCNVKIQTGSSIKKKDHTPSSDWTTDGTYHWKVCTVSACSAVLDKTAHTGGVATCKDKAVCSVCEAAYGELNANNHVGETEIRGAVTASCNTPGYTGDTWCKDCNTKIETGRVIDPTGAHVDANGKWESNGTQHFHTCSCGTEFDKAGHTGGVATCKDKAVCSVCEAAYGELNANNHVGETEIRGAVTESCNTPGYTGDTWCKDCNTKIETGRVIDPTGAHVDANGKWESNGTQHFHTCGCGTEFDKAGHTGGEATCKDKAVCSVCEASYGELNANNHKNTEVRDAVTESCNAPGYTGDIWCKDCNTKIETGRPIDPTGAHVDANGKWESNGTQHFHTCSCGTEFDKAGHTGGEATCKDKAVCSVCEAAYGELNANNHAGETEIKDAAEAKCNKEGYTGDTYCKDCGTKIADGEKIKKIPHIVKEWTVSKEATKEETGLKTGTCSVCGEAMTVETAKLVETVKPENIEGTDVKIEIIGDSNISEDVVFKAEEILNSIAQAEKEKVDKAVKTAIEKFEEIKENVKVGAIFDLSLVLRETNTNGDVIGETELKLDGKVKVTIPVPETMLNTLEGLKLLHVKDDGTVEVVAFTLADGKATFEATGFSYYTFVGTEKQVAPSGGNGPQTGDASNIVMWCALAFVSLVTLGRIVVIKRRDGHRA